MRAVVQRVKKASVSIDNNLISEIGEGLLVLVGIEHDDNENDIEYLVSKITNLRIFSDHEGKMNLSVNEVLGELLIVSQFTLHALTKKGNRPSFIRAANPLRAIPLYEKFIFDIKNEIKSNVKSGQFGADMDVLLLNSGPVTIIIDSKCKDF